MLKVAVKIIIRFFLHALWIFPVNKNKVFFCSFKGSTIACNPYYIFRELQKQRPNAKYIWCCNSDEKKSQVQNKNVKFVKINTMKYIYSLITSRILVNNSGFPSWLPFRTKKQLVINTWHGGGAYKRVATSEINSLEIRKREEFTAKGTSYFISSSKIFTQVMIPSVLVPEEKFLNIGMPRNDIFFNSTEVQNTNKKVRNSLRLNADDYIILYAPTYRESSLKHSSFDSQLDINLIKKAAEKKFCKAAKILFRGHYFFTANNTQSFSLDASDYPNMQELLCAADMLITDYSSSMWDYSFTGKPCLLFCPDIDEYIQKRGFYTEPKKWGFPICKSNQELADTIQNFDMEKYADNIKKNHEYFGSYEKGDATKKVCSVILPFIKE